MPKKKLSTGSNGSSSTSILSFFKREEKHDQGSAADPVVISDGEEQVVKRRRVSAAKGINGTPKKARPTNGGIHVIEAPSTTHTEVVELNDDDSNPDSEGDSDEIACMVCGVSIPQSEAETHINACLDAQPKAKLLPEKRKEPPLTKETKHQRNDLKPKTEARPQPITSISHSIRTPSPPAQIPNGKGKGTNAFALLMSGNKEKELWADVDEPKRIKNRRAAPFYKVLTGMPIAVDAFCYGAIPGITAYFLTHAHSDHYTNLSKSWRHGPIYCSHTTANLIILKLGVEAKWVHGLPNDEELEVPNTGGVKVTLMDANHCPGSSLFLFEGLQTANAGDSSFRSPYVGSKRVFRYLHCGDFRACPKHILHPAVARGKLDTVYLDTTYLNPQYCFPPQPLVIRACAELARRIACEDEDVKVEPKESMDEDEVVDPPREEDIGDAGEFELPARGCLGLQDDVMLEDIKPDINGEDQELLPLFPGVDLIDTKPAKPDHQDTKPDIKPHPATLAYEAHERSVTMMSTWLNKDASDVVPKVRGRVLVLVGTYSIGKERVVKAVAQALGSKIYCDARKRQIILAQDDPELHALLSEDPKESQVHIVPLNHISLDHLQPYLDALRPAFSRVLGFRPTGWTYRPPKGANTMPDVNFVIKRDQSQGFSDVSLKPIRGSSRVHMMFGVPYSEHSSFFELTCFSLSTPGDPRIIATVNVHSEKSRVKMRKWFEKWAAEKARRREKGLGMVEYRDESYW